MQDRQSRTLEVARRMFEVENKITTLQEELNTLKQEFAKLVPRDDGASVGSNASNEQSHSTMNLRERIVATLTGRSMTSSEVGEALGGATNLDTVRSTMSRLGSQGYLKRGADGKWTATEKRMSQ